MRSDICDLAIIGGGLAGGLIALAMARHRPELRVMLIERGEALGGHHVWSFFARDLPEGADALVAPVIAARWDGYQVHFPGPPRVLTPPPRSMRSQEPRVGKTC